MKKLFALAAALMIGTSAVAQDYLDTQFGPYGWNVHLLRTSVSNNVLTVAFMIESTSSGSEFMDSMDVSEVAYTTSDKKFPVLTDANGQYLASTIGYEEHEEEVIFAGVPNNSNRVRFSAGEKQVGWIKFEAPGDADWPIDLSLPGVSPFTIDRPES